MCGQWEEIVDVTVIEYSLNGCWLLPSIFLVFYFNLCSRGVRPNPIAKLTIIIS